jgi:hypothetical protein
MVALSCGGFPEGYKGSLISRATRKSIRRRVRAGNLRERNHSA